MSPVRFAAPPYLGPYHRDTIRAYADGHPELEWISGNGWYGDTFPGGLPTRHFLDEIVPNRPAAFVSHDGHDVWANSRALELAKIDDRAPDPVNGRINRDGDGLPTGILVERAGDLVTNLLPPVTDEFAETAILRAQSHLHTLGVTGWLDACVGPLWGCLTRCPPTDGPPATIFRADNELLVNPQVHGIAAAYAPVLHLRRVELGGMFATYVDCFERGRVAAAPMNTTAPAVRVISAGG